MKYFALGATLSILVASAFPISSSFAADSVPCEKMLGALRATAKTAALSDSDRAKVADLEGKGIERCNADDDIHADALFAEALRVMGK